MIFAPHAEPYQIIKETTGYTHFWEASSFAETQFFMKFPWISSQSENAKEVAFCIKKWNFTEKVGFSWFRGIGTLEIINISLGILMILRVRRGNAHFMGKSWNSMKILDFHEFREKLRNSENAGFRKKHKTVKVVPGGAPD